MGECKYGLPLHLLRTMASMHSYSQSSGASCTWPVRTCGGPLDAARLRLRLGNQERPQLGKQARRHQRLLLHISSKGEGGV